MNQLEPIRFPPDYPEVLEHVGQIVYRELCERGLHPRIAADMALLVADSICTEFGGTQPYIPRALSYRLSHRDAEIFQEFRGDNYPQLARRYSLSEQQVRNIVRRGIELQRQRHEPELF